MAKEWVSVSYVEAIAAQAGLNIKNCRWDDGIDIEVGSNKKLPGFPEITGLYLSLQLKSTVNWDIEDGAIGYQLKASNYTSLRYEFPHNPRYLVLYTLPYSRSQWISYSPDHVRFHNRAYFADLKGLPELQTRPSGKTPKSRKVNLPASNLLTASSMLRLYRKACEDVVSLRRSSA